MSCVIHRQISLLRTAVSFWALPRPAYFFSWLTSASRQQNKREDEAQFEVFYQGGSEGVAWESSASQFFQETCLTLSKVILQCRFPRITRQPYYSLLITQNMRAGMRPISFSLWWLIWQTSSQRRAPGRSEMPISACVYENVSKQKLESSWSPHIHTRKQRTLNTGCQSAPFLHLHSPRPQ